VLEKTGGLKEAEAEATTAKSATKSMMVDRIER